MLQVQPYPSNPTISGTLVNANDAVTMPALGDQLATVRWIVSTAGTSAISTEISIDGGVNWLASAYSKTLTVSANPTVAPWANNTASAGTFETPIPGNCTHFRVRCATGGTASVVQVQAGAAYCPGTPVVAELSDVTLAFTVAGGSGTLDVSGWSSLFATLVNSDSGGTSRAFNINYQADDGAALSADTTTVNSGAAGKWVLTTLPRRLSVGIGAGTGASGSARLVVYARR